MRTCQVCQPVPSCHFTMLTKNWCIDFLKVNKFDLAEARRLCNICGLGNPSLECEYLLPLKSTTLAMYRTQKPTQKLKYCFLSAHAQSDKLCKARKLFSSNEMKKKLKNEDQKANSDASWIVWIRLEANWIQHFLRRKYVILKRLENRRKCRKTERSKNEWPLYSVTQKSRCSCRAYIHMYPTVLIKAISWWFKLTLSRKRVPWSASYEWPMFMTLVGHFGP